jgi:hypothetical protein
MTLTAFLQDLDPKEVHSSSFRESLNGPQKKRKINRLTKHVHSAPENSGLCTRMTNLISTRFSEMRECPVCLFPNLGSARSFSEHIDIHIQELLRQISDKSFQDLINSHFFHQIRIRSFIESQETEDITSLPFLEKFPGLPQ